MIIHVVQSGESIRSISDTYGVNLNDTAAANGIMAGQTLVAGQTVVLDSAGDTKKLGRIEVNGYAYPGLSNAVMQKILPYLTYLSIFSYNVREDGTLYGLADEPIIEQCKSFKTQPVMVITNICAEGRFNSGLASSILNSDIAREKLLENVLRVMRQKGYKGLNIDFEYVCHEDKAAYSSFIVNAAAFLGNEGFFITSALAPRSTLTMANADTYSDAACAGHDYKLHGEVADRVTLMTYEWGGINSPPMAVAPVTHTKRALDCAKMEINPHKIMLGMPNFGYDRALPDRTVTSMGSTPARALDSNQAIEQAAKLNASIQYDHAAQSPFYLYSTHEGIDHSVWFEDARSIEAKLRLIYDYDLCGVSLWTVNRPFPQGWLVLNAMYDVFKKTDPAV